jgi:beta-galactosidase beta subunit
VTCAREEFSFFWSQVFDKIEQGKNHNLLEGEIEITVFENRIYFSWNNDEIQDLAEALGETEFPEPRPCG